MRTEAGIRVMLPQAKETSGITRSWKRQKDPPRASGESAALPMPWFQTSGLRSVREHISAV